jgi:Flp pilus assembly pilin Flp
MIQWLRDHLRSTGQSMVEFSIILVLVACVAIAAITVAGNELSKTYEDINQALMSPGDTTASTGFTCPDGIPSRRHRPAPYLTGVVERKRLELSTSAMRVRRSAS